MSIEKIKEKMDAIRTAESCMNSVLSVNPNVDLLNTFVLLNELKMDLLDILDEKSEKMLDI
jgi:hypothetical protein